MPFCAATARDRLYKNFIDGTLDKFWDYHEKACGSDGNNVFPDDLRDLLEKMLQSDPNERPSIKEIKTHSWCQKETIKEDEVESYFRQVQNKLMGASTAN